MIERLLAELGLAFDAAKIPYMVIGGQAVLVHGVARLTQDVDVTVGLSISELDRLLAVLPRCGLEPLVEPRSFASETMVVPCKHVRSGIRVDLVLSDTPYEREALARARPVRVGAGSVRFVSAEDLIVHKVIAGRPRDLEDVRGIVAKNPALDQTAVRRWLANWSALVDDDLVRRFDDLDRP